MKKILSVLLTLSSVTVFASDIQVGFSGGDGSEPTALSIVETAINSAQTSIDVLAYSLSNKKIAYDLINAQKRGVTVRVIADANQNNNSYTVLPLLQKNGIQVKTNNNYQDFHNKVMIVDNSCVQTGSFNYSSSAVYKNAENAIYFCDKSIANQYENQFNYWWK